MCIDDPPAGAASAGPCLDFDAVYIDGVCGSPVILVEVIDRQFVGAIWPCEGTGRGAGTGRLDGLPARSVDIVLDLIVAAQGQGFRFSCSDYDIGHCLRSQLNCLVC